MARIYQDIASVLEKVESKEDSIRNVCFNNTRYSKPQIYAMVCGVLKCSCAYIYLPHISSIVIRFDSIRFDRRVLIR